MRRWVGIGLAVATVVIASFAVMRFGLLEPSVVGSDLDTPLSPEALHALVPRGQYLAVAADCYACHTNGNGPPWAGGLPFETPFGTIHATNISPHAQDGIGTWTRRDFHRALRDGIAPGNRHLYPAMPYASYRNLTTDDVDAIYAYLMTRAPMAQSNVDNDLMFPMNIRAFVSGWNLLALSEPETDQAGKSVEWNRGRYLTDALGHCGECHTPRNFMMIMERSRYLQGSLIEGIEAPALTRDALGVAGFEPEGLQRFMRIGLSPQGAMTGPMFDVVHFSTQYFTGPDLAAMAAYLLGNPPPVVKAILPAPVTASVAESGQRTYFAVCAGCHGIDGEGLPHVSVPMRTNSSLRLPSPRSFLTTIAHGINAQDFPDLEKMQAMPGFTGTVSDQDLADLATWMRATWGGRGTPVTAAEVAQFKR